MQNKQNSPSNLVISPIKDILKQFVVLIESILIHNLASYLFLPDFRGKVNALIRPWLILSAVCLVGIAMSLFIFLAGR